MRSNLYLQCFVEDGDRETDPILSVLIRVYGVNGIWVYENGDERDDFGSGDTTVFEDMIDHYGDTYYATRTDYRNNNKSSFQEWYNSAEVQAALKEELVA